jgi:hypothetical protein
MKKPLNTVMLLAAAILYSVATNSLLSQTVPECKIKAIKPEFINSPPTGGFTQSKKTKAPEKPKWLAIDVEFDMPLTKTNEEKGWPIFTDDIIVNYYILLNNSEVNYKLYNKDKRQTLLIGSISHKDIFYDNELFVGAFVSPQALLKCFNTNNYQRFVTVEQAIASICVTISDSYSVLAVKQWKPWKGIEYKLDDEKKGWWHNKKRNENAEEEFRSVSGLVLAKDATPFAYSAWDFYLPLKPAATSPIPSPSPAGL